MPLITFAVYRTVIVDGVATGDSELIELTINDLDGNESINRTEWQAYTGNPNGHIGGTPDGSVNIALWDSDGGATNNTADGILYTSVPITGGTDVVSILSEITHAPKYDVAIAELSVCFLAGTMIATPTGEKAVEDLRAGDLVMTRDHGPQPLVWVGHTDIDTDRLDQNPNLRPIRIEAGALDGQLPRRSMAVSAQHRMLMTGKDGAEYLVAARHLQAAGARGFSVVKDDQPFTLVHISCANHEVIEAEGAATESFYTGPMAVKALRPVEKLSLFAAFPGLAAGENPMTPARPFLKRKDVAATLGDAAVNA